MRWSGGCVQHARPNPLCSCGSTCSTHATPWCVETASAAHAQSQLLKPSTTATAVRGRTLPLTTIQQDSSSACFETCRMLYSFMDAAPGPASTPPAVGACCAGCGAAADPAGLTMKLLAASDALFVAVASCCWASAASCADRLVDKPRQWPVAACWWPRRLNEVAEQAADLQRMGWCGQVTSLVVHSLSAWLDSPDERGQQRMVGAHCCMMR